MSHAESTGPTTPEPTASAPHRVRRLWVPLAAIVLAVVAILAMRLFTVDRLQVGDRNSLSVIIGLVALIATAAWFFFASGIAASTRLTAAILLAALGVTAVAAVRRVEFSGDMVPTFDFRWTTDRMAALERHRAESGGAAAGAAREPISIDPSADDILEYRGPNRDGIVPGPKLARDWQAHPPKLLWRQPVGGGYASFVTVGPTIATIEQRRENESVVAYDAATGRELWVYAYPALFSETLGGDGPRATPTFHQGKLYALGATGVLTCLDFATGKSLWSLNILKENESGNLDWAMSGSPLVYDGLVLVNPGNQKGTPSSRSLVAYDLAEGKKQWSAGQTKASYASPVLAALAGMRQLLIFDAAGLAGHDPSDGRELWRYPWTSDFDINASQPVVLDGDRVAISSSSGTALLKISHSGDKWQADEVWRNRNLKCGYSNPIAYDGHLYGIDENMLACLDLETGKRKWKSRDGQYGHGQMLLRGDLLVILGEAGELALVPASPEKFEELGRIQAIEGKTWNVPVLVGTRIYVRNHLEMAAYELKVEE